MTNTAFDESRQDSGLPSGVEIHAPWNDGCSEILSPEALRFVATLERRFRDTRRELLECRSAIQQTLDAGAAPDFLPETYEIRQGDWRIAPVPADLQDRRIEITGPVDRKMVINALNSGANVFMADFEDSNAPTWDNVIQGQVNLRDAVRGTIDFVQPESGKTYQLKDRPATLVVRPRGWHLPEKHVTVDGEPVSASIFDFALYFFHNVEALLRKGTGPYFYLAKLENHREARLWNEVFLAAQLALGIPAGTIKATVLIETILAVFEMDEILWELRDHAAGLNCGRWDYIFSFIKKFRVNPNFVLPDRGLVGMDCHFLRSYSRLLIQTCHRRGAHAMGGMAAQIPIKRDPAANEIALEKVRADKQREAHAGHDGSWVAHPGLVSLARAEFDAVLDGPNQLSNTRDDVWVTAKDLLEVPEGPRTEAGLRQNINVGILYLEAWLRGKGCVPLYDLMEDAATAEISRTQIWQWIRHRASLEDGRAIDVFLVKRLIEEELETIRTSVGESAWENGRFPLAGRLFTDLVTSQELEEFLTLVAYDHL
ncbi:MAG: malate synthase [Gemmatimonadota bacterium]|nr:MAG: malate synthase [Gemmatimonadota bacterium]